MISRILPRQDPIKTLPPRYSWFKFIYKRKNFSFKPQLNTSDVGWRVRTGLMGVDRKSVRENWLVCNHQQFATWGNSFVARRSNSWRFLRGCSCVLKGTCSLSLPSFLWTPLSDPIYLQFPLPSLCFLFSFSRLPLSAHFLNCTIWFVFVTSLSL